jgi:SecD/SecF fusion protein
MRDQPDFRDAFGREVQVVGLDAADPTDPSKGFTSLAVLVTDPLTDYGKVDFEIWDSRLAAREWALVSHALERPATLEQISEFSSAVAQTFRANAIVAVFLSIAGILVYIWVRFGSLRYSAGAVLALAHDVSIGIGALALSQYIATTAFGQNLLLLEFHIDLEVVAAVLTLIGYSLNDTIVILDRIRENRGKLQFPTAEIVNKSINQTFSRTVLTNLTMIISLMVLYIVGGPGIRAFAYVMLVGMIVGTYSSVAIAAPMVFKGHDKPATKGAKREIEPVVRETVPVGR